MQIDPDWCVIIAVIRIHLIMWKIIQEFTVKHISTEQIAPEQIPPEQIPPEQIATKPILPKRSHPEQFFKDQCPDQISATMISFIDNFLNYWRSSFI